MAHFKEVWRGDQLTGYAHQINDADVAFYPLDHPEVAAWLADGNTPDPPDPLPERGPSPAEQLDQLVADGTAAIEAAGSLPQLKDAFADVLAGLGSIYGTGGS